MGLSEGSSTKVVRTKGEGLLFPTWTWLARLDVAEG